MNLVGKTVSHSKFGSGKIVSTDDTHVTVDFAIDQKTFQFPEAFAKFLSIDDKDAKKHIDTIIDFKNEKIRLEAQEEIRKDNLRAEVIEMENKQVKERKKKKV